MRVTVGGGVHDVLGSEANIFLMLYFKKISFVCACLSVYVSIFLVLFFLGSFFLFSVVTSFMST